MPSFWKVFKPFFLVLLGIVAFEVILILTSDEFEEFHLRRALVQEQKAALKFSQEPYLWNSRQLSNNDDLTYENTDDTSYSPSQYVRYGHEITGMKFAVTMSYGQRLLYAPIITFGLGFIAIFLTHFALLCRCCFDCCRCLPNTESVHYDRDRFCLTVFYIILALLVLIIDQLVFLGNESLDTGVELFRSDIKSLNNKITLMTDDTTALENYGDSLSTEYTAATNSCHSAFIDGYSSYIQSYQSDVNSVSSSLKSVNNKISLVNTYINTYAIFYRTIGLYVIWGLAIVCSLFFFLAKFCESIGLTKFTIFISTITYLLFLVLGVPWLLITSGGGDLCMNPSENIIKSIPITDVKNISYYYATCTGTSVIQVSINQGVSNLNTLNQSLTELLTPPLIPDVNCPGDPNVKAMQSTIDSISSTIDDLESLLSCPSIQYLWYDMVNTGLCTDLYQGIFYIWGSQLVTSFLLFVLIVIAAILYQYYDVAKIVPQNDDDSEESDEDEEALAKVVVGKNNRNDEDESL